MITVTQLPHRQFGISYVEVLAAVIVIALALAPLATDLRGAMDVAEADSLATNNHYRLLSKLEEVLAEPFATVADAVAGPANATAYSDAAGTVDRRLVYIALYDGDNADADGDYFTGGDAHLLWIKVEIEDSVVFLQALKSRQ